MVDAIHALEGYEKTVEGLVAELEALSKINKALSQATAEVQVAHGSVIRVESEFQSLLATNESLTQEVKRLRPSDFVSEFDIHLTEASGEIKDQNDQIIHLIEVTALEAATARKQFAALGNGLVAWSGELERAVETLRKLQVDSGAEARERSSSLSSEIRAQFDEAAAASVLSNQLTTNSLQILSGHAGSTRDLCSAIAMTTTNILKDVGEGTPLLAGRVDSVTEHVERSGSQITRLLICSILLSVAILVSIWVKS